MTYAVPPWQTRPTNWRKIQTLGRVFYVSFSEKVF